MQQKLLATKHSMKMMWGCVALAMLAGIVALTVNASVLLFIIPCALMLGAMMWMMMGESGDEPHGGDEK